LELQVAAATAAATFYWFIMATLCLWAMAKGRCGTSPHKLNKKYIKNTPVALHLSANSAPKTGRCQWDDQTVCLCCL